MGRTPVRLMNDYRLDGPLWAADGCADEDDWPVAPASNPRLMV